MGRQNAAAVITGILLRQRLAPGVQRQIDSVFGQLIVGGDAVGIIGLVRWIWVLAIDRLVLSLDRLEFNFPFEEQRMPRLLFPGAEADTFRRWLLIEVL